MADAIRRGDRVDLKDELGDLLLQVVYHARMAEEEAAFRFEDVVLAITTEADPPPSACVWRGTAQNPGTVKALWDAIKAEEKLERAEARQAAGLPDDMPKGLLGGVKSALPGFVRALKLQQKASSVGFDWNDARLVLDKIEEETREVRVALDAGEQTDIEDEIGDLLFAMVNSRGIPRSIRRWHSSARMTSFPAVLPPSKPPSPRRDARSVTPASTRWKPCGWLRRIVATKRPQTAV